MALALGVGAAAAACGGGGAGPKVSLKTKGGAAGAAGATPTTAGAGSTATTAPAAGAPGSTDHPSTTTAVTPSGGTHTTTTVATTSPKTTVPSTTGPSTTGPAPTAPGTYRYNATGGSTITMGTTTSNFPAATYDLTVSAPVNGTETWTDPNTTTSFLFNGSGVFLVSESVSAVNATCAFGSPVASPPWPLKVGETFSGQASCGGGQSLTLSGHVAATSAVGGVATFTVQTTITLTSTDLVIAETDWYAPSLRLPVKSTVAASGQLDGYSLSSDSTYTLASV